MEPTEYYVEWREDFDDHSGWFCKSQVKDLIDRIIALQDDGEATIHTIIKGYQRHVDDFKDEG